MGKSHGKRSDSLKENKMAVPHEKPTLPLSDCDQSDLVSVVESTTDDQKEMPYCADNLCQRSSSEAIPIPHCMERRIKHVDCLDHHEEKVINEQFHSERSIGQLGSSDILDFVTDNHSNNKPIPDEREDSLLLYSASPISCSSSSSESSE